MKITPLIDPIITRFTIIFNIIHSPVCSTTIIIITFLLKLAEKELKIILNLDQNPETYITMN